MYAFEQNSIDLHSRLPFSLLLRKDMVFDMDENFGRIQNMDRGPWTTTRTRSMGPWTTPNFQKEMAPVKMEIYWRSGYEKQICVRRVKCHFTVTPVKYS